VPGNQNTVVVDRQVLEHEVVRILETAERAQVPVRVLGSIGVAMHCPDAGALIERFERTYADIDLAAYRRDASGLVAALSGMGYVEDREVTINSEGRRLIFDHPATRIHLDVFFDQLEFCHRIPLRNRLEADRPTIPLAELLLSKLQIVRLNQKDAVDACLLLLDHELGDGDVDCIDMARIGRLCADDWGWWRTLTMNLEKVRALAEAYPQLDGPQRLRVAAACNRLKQAIDEVPKSLGWRMRARVGDRRQWWTDVDEVR
jgi:hypothetical protein